MIALWLGHQSTHSTDAYLHADMAIKQALPTGPGQPTPAWPLPARTRHPRLAHPPMNMPTLRTRKHT